MIARTQITRGLLGTVALTLAVLFFTGCRSSSGSRSGGCGGGCCRGQDAASLRPAGEAHPYSQVAATSNADTAAGLPSGASATDSKPYGGQKTCPVTGEELGSMGPAIPVSVKGQTVYVCCRGCAAKVQRDPDTYLSKVMAERSGS